MAQAVQAVSHGAGAPVVTKGAAAGSGTLTLDALSTDIVGSVSSTPNADDTTGIISTTVFSKPFKVAPAAVFIAPLGDGFAVARPRVSSITATQFVITGAVDPGGASLAYQYLVIPQDGEV